MRDMLNMSALLLWMWLILFRLLRHGLVHSWSCLRCCRDTHHVEVAPYPPVYVHMGTPPLPLAATSCSLPLSTRTTTCYDCEHVGNAENKGEDIHTTNNNHNTTLDIIYSPRTPSSPSLSASPTPRPPNRTTWSTKNIKATLPCSIFLTLSFLTTFATWIFYSVTVWTSSSSSSHDSSTSETSGCNSHHVLFVVHQVVVFLTFFLTSYDLAHLAF